jgi:pimeloyl-ACP methyl ester carboxylesterase
VRTSFLEVAYDERGDPGAPAVVLLPGFPADAQTCERVAGLLTDAGYRLLAPYLRGFGATRFLDEDTPEADNSYSSGKTPSSSPML